MINPGDHQLILPIDQNQNKLFLRNLLHYLYLPKRRRFTAEYKLRILREADRCSKPGELGALLRQEGLYSSNLTTWRCQQNEGLLHALTPKKRGRKAHTPNPLTRRVVELERQNQHLSQRLKQAEIIIEAQKKISQLLESPLNAPENGGNK